MLSVFNRAVHETASADYSPEQVRAWAPTDPDLAQWSAARAAATGFVAVADGSVIGFTEVDDSGHVNMMFVDPDWVRQGVASQLLEQATAHAVLHGATTMTTDASVTARGFFESHGFVAIAAQHPVRAGVMLTNYRMTRDMTELPHDVTPEIQQQLGETDSG